MFFFFAPSLLLLYWPPYINSWMRYLVMPFRFLFPHFSSYESGTKGAECSLKYGWALIWVCWQKLKKAFKCAPCVSRPLFSQELSSLRKTVLTRWGFAFASFNDRHEATCNIYAMWCRHVLLGLISLKSPGMPLGVPYHTGEKKKCL